MINEIVKQMLEEHEGGEVFFDNLDEAIRKDNNILSTFLDTVDHIIEVSDVNINHVIVSGNFGRALHNYGAGEHLWVAYDIDLIVVNGSLRKGQAIDEFGEFMNKPDGNYLFLDDSFYSGKTRNVIKDKIESYGGKLIHTHVLYDGCYETHDDVSSMYRYYDNH